MPSAWRALIFLAVLAVGYLLLNSISAFAHLGQMVVYAIIFGVFFLGFATGERRRYLGGGDARQIACETPEGRGHYDCHAPYPRQSQACLA